MLLFVCYLLSFCFAERGGGSPYFEGKAKQLGAIIPSLLSDIPRVLPSCLVSCTLSPRRGREWSLGGGGMYGILSKQCLTVIIIIMFLIQFVAFLHRQIRTARLAANNRASFPSSAPWQCSVILARSHSIEFVLFPHFVKQRLAANRRAQLCTKQKRSRHFPMERVRLLGGWGQAMT